MTPLGSHMPLPFLAPPGTPAIALRAFGDSRVWAHPLGTSTCQQQCHCSKVRRPARRSRGSPRPRCALQSPSGCWLVERRRAPGEGLGTPRLWAAAAPHLFASVVMSPRLETHPSLPDLPCHRLEEAVALVPTSPAGKRADIVCQERPLYGRLLFLPIPLPPS